MKENPREESEKEKDNYVEKENEIKLYDD